MIRRTTIVLASILLVSIGAGAAWVMMTVPRDVEAQSLLRDARTLLQQGHEPEAREKLLDILERYPRTDAGAAAAFALFRIEERQRTALERRIVELESTRTASESAARANDEQEAKERLSSRERIERLEAQLAETNQRLEALTKAATKKAPTKRR